ncbi:MarR family transcriptional regulator [Anaerosinus massiliensis]|uniref:MarR family transcriptional regulator n=1 Tax=Massilibacillus massiliensis TaxID=1806837 RepID=UPI000DA6382C|nr:MarR family transcriptional regulator [Massilibacillus massiliensis]
MSNQIEQLKFLRAEEVAEILQVSKWHAYKIIRDLNEELKKKGKIVVAGRISRRYFEEKFY